MIFPDWVQEKIRNFQPPKTGKVVIEIEYYLNGVTRMEIGDIVRFKPEREREENNLPSREKRL